MSKNDATVELRDMADDIDELLERIDKQIEQEDFDDDDAVDLENAKNNLSAAKEKLLDVAN